MKNYYLISAFLLGLLNTTNNAMDNTIIKGKLSLRKQKAIHLTYNHAKKASEILGIDDVPMDRFISVCAEVDDCDLYLKEYAEIKKFPSYLPVFLLQDKKENDLLELTIDGILVQLCCTQLHKGILFQDYLKILTKKKSNKSAHFAIS
jgi:hypothetical protein